MFLVLTSFQYDRVNQVAPFSQVSGKLLEVRLHRVSLKRLFHLPDCAVEIRL